MGMSRALREDLNHSTVGFCRGDADRPSHGGVADTTRWGHQWHEDGYLRKQDMMSKEADHLLQLVPSLQRHVILNRMESTFEHAIGILTEVTSPTRAFAEVWAQHIAIVEFLGILPPSIFTWM